MLFRSRGTCVNGSVTAHVGEATLGATVIRHATHNDAHKRILFINGWRDEFSWVNPYAVEAEAAAHGAGLAAPMPGKILALLVEAGSTVKAGTPLLVMEAMKMEHSIVAPSNGTAKAFCYAVGEQVAEGALLVEFEAAA